VASSDALIKPDFGSKRRHFLFSDEHEQLRDSIGAFVERELAPHAEEWERTTFPDWVFHRMGELGFLGLSYPERYGGQGGDYYCNIVLAEEMTKSGSGGLATGIAVHTDMATPPILMFGTEQQKRRYLVPAVKGEKISCLGITEPDAGSDVAGVKTRAVRDGDDYVVDGSKHFISHADKSDFVILFASTGSEKVRGRDVNLITGFLVDLDTPGLTVVPGPKSVSHRGYHHSELVFEGCRVPAANRLGDEGAGFDLMGEWLGASRLTVAATSVGRARRVLEMTTQWAADRHQFGQPIGRFQGVGFQLADMVIELEAAELLTLRAAWKLDQGTMTDQDAAMAKVLASETLGRITDRAVQIHGGMGLMEELPIERFWRDARVERIWDGTSEVQRHIISRSLLRPLGA
jgi:acyl-CoA dehydrogenase